MSENPPEPAAAPPAVEPTLEHGDSAPDLPFARLYSAVRRLREVSIPRFVIRGIAEKDISCLRILRDMAAMEREEVPSRAELERAKKQLALAIQTLNLLQSQRGRRSAKMRSLESQLYQRVTTLQEIQERIKVAAIQRKLGPRYQTRSEPPPESESPSPTSPAP